MALLELSSSLLIYFRIINFCCNYFGGNTNVVIKHIKDRIVAHKLGSFGNVHI